MTIPNSLECFEATNICQDKGSGTAMATLRSRSIEAKPEVDQPPMKYTTSAGKHGLNLEEYTKNFKGDKVFGWQFRAPLKWGKIFMIFGFYITAIVLLFIFPLERVRVVQVLWGKGIRSN